MSDHPGIRCDKCGALALLSEVDKRHLPPERWGYVTIGRHRPFFKTQSLDLCDGCLVSVYEFVTGRKPAT